MMGSGGWISERRTRRRRCDEETMRGLQTRRVKAHHLVASRREECCRVCSVARSLVPPLTKGCFFTRKCRARHSGGRINRAERASRARKHTRRNTLGPRFAIRFSLFPAEARFPGNAWPLLIKPDDCETRQPVTVSRDRADREPIRLSIAFSPWKGKAFRVGD